MLHIFKYIISLRRKIMLFSYNFLEIHVRLTFYYLRLTQLMHYKVGPLKKACGRAYKDNIQKVYDLHEKIDLSIDGRN